MKVDTLNTDELKIQIQQLKKQLNDLKVSSKQTQEELKTSYKKFMTLYENTIDCIFVYDLKVEKVIQANKAALELFGYSREEFLNLGRFEVIPQYTAFLPGVDLHKAHVAGGKKMIKEGQFQAKTIFQKRNKELVFVDFLAIPTGNHPAECFIILKDTSEEVLSRKRLKESRNEIEAKNKVLEKYIESNMQLENFAYLASHDLRSPLQNIINFSNLLSENKSQKLSLSEQNYLKIIKEGAHRMQDTIQDLLKFSLVSSQDLNLEKVNTLTCIETLKDDLKYLILRHNVHFELNNLPESIQADKGLIRQLMQNLVANAIKFSKHLDRPMVEIGSIKDKRDHIIYVKDQGIGIPEKDQETIFIIFKRLHNNINYEGTGIGLALCKAIIEKHQGRIWVESKEGKGATFYFSIPKR